jgi:hypothetical protein
MVRAFGRNINARTRLQGQLRAHKMNGLTTIHLGNASTDKMKAELKRINRDIKHSNIGNIMTQRKARIDANDTPATEEDKFHMKHNDLLKFADRMMTEDNIKNKIFEGKEIDPSINHKALLTRDWVRWKEDFNGKIKYLKLLINRSVIGINKKFEGEDLGYNPRELYGAFWR